MTRHHIGGLGLVWVFVFFFFPWIYVRSGYKLRITHSTQHNSTWVTFFFSKRPKSSFLTKCKVTSELCVLFILIQARARPKVFLLLVQNKTVLVALTRLLIPPQTEKRTIQLPRAPHRPHQEQPELPHKNATNTTARDSLVRRQQSALC
jgi:hypothetical protein